ncbi:hypothetical protein ACIXNV_03815 [Bacteroides fragilis]
MSFDKPVRERDRELARTGLLCRRPPDDAGLKFKSVRQFTHGSGGLLSSVCNGVYQIPLLIGQRCRTSSMSFMRYPFHSLSSGMNSGSSSRVSSSLIVSGRNKSFGKYLDSG